MVRAREWLVAWDVLAAQHELAERQHTYDAAARYRNRIMEIDTLFTVLDVVEIL